MIAPFKDADDFIEARDGRGIDMSCFNAVLDSLNYEYLGGVLSAILPVRLMSAVKFLRDAGRKCGVGIELKLSLSSHLPYMTESGLVCMSFRDFFRSKTACAALAHEVSHFILMTDPCYPRLKALDGEYCALYSDGALRSPIEYCANMLTAAIVQRCAAVLKKESRRKKAGSLSEKLENFTD